MAKRTTKKNVDHELWRARLDKAILFQRQAQNNYDLLDEAADATGVLSDVILAAIAFGDALTIKALGQTNKDNHTNLPALIRQSLGNRASASQITILTKLLTLKSEVQYGHKRIPVNRAKQSLENLEKFSIWVQQMLKEL